MPQSKTDVYREGNYVYIVKLKSKYFPVSILSRYIEDLSTQLSLFRPLTKKKSGYSIRNGKLSYTRCREIFEATRDYGLHSLRSGGATAVISNDVSSSVSERLLKLHGRWKTNEAKDIYVLESESN